MFRLYRRRFALLFAAALFSVIPLGLIITAALILFGAFNGFSATTSTTAQAASAVGFLIALVLLPASVYAPWRAALAAALGEPMTTGRILRDTFRNYLRLWWLSIAYGFLAIVCSLTFFTCLLIPLGIWLLVKWCLVVPVWICEQHRVGYALGRSWALTQRNWWRLLGLLVLFYILTNVVSAGLGSFTYVVAFVPQEWRAAFTIVNIVVEIGLYAVLVPLFPLVLTLLYLDLRVRHEHLDLEVMARRLVTTEPEWVLPTAPGAPAT